MQESHGKFFVLLIWCSTLALLRNADAQGYLYKNKDITQYEIRNGKYKLVTSTTPPPSLLETFFPWAGNSYNSVRTPEEDAALINSLSDPPDSSSSSSSDGLMSWFPSIPGFGGSSAPPSTGASANSIFGGPPTGNMGPPPSGMMGPPPPGYPYSGPPPQGPYPGPVPMNYNGPPPPMLGAASINQPIYVPPPGEENQLAMQGPPPPGGFEQYPPFMDYPPPPPGMPLDYPPPPSGMPLDYPPPPPGMFSDYPPPPPGQPMMDYPPSSFGMPMDYPPPPPGQQMMDYPPPPYGMPFYDYPPPPPPGHMPPQPPSPQQYPPPQQLPSNHDPTFQFHQQMKDSLPLPSPSIFGFGLPQFPFPYTTDANLLSSVKNATTDKPPETYLEMLAKYLTFGKRSDLEEVVDLLEKRSDLEGDFIVEIKSEEEHNLETDLKAKISKDQKDGENFDKLKETQESSDSKYFPCPKSGIWRWNGEVCIAVGPVPVWACKPNDMMVSGKLAICKNKIFFSPKVINTMYRENEDSKEIS